MVYQLTYNIAEEHLVGYFAGVRIDCAAGSGGRAGSKAAGAGNWWLQNNPLATQVHAGAHGFGPLPQGLYHMEPHETHKAMVRLDPFPANAMHGRSGFLIHGRGSIGSHGCIVPYNFGEVVKVCSAVQRWIKANDSKPVLRVIAVGMNVDRKFYTA